MDVIGFLTSSTTAVVVSVVIGLLVKYLPKAVFISRIPNVVIPYLNALVIFFTAWPAQAHAGIFGHIDGVISAPIKAILSMAISAMATVVYETYVRHPLEKLGWKKA